MYLRKNYAHFPCLRNYFTQTVRVGLAGRAEILKVMPVWVRNLRVYAEIHQNYEMGNITHGRLGWAALGGNLNWVYHALNLRDREGRKVSE